MASQGEASFFVWQIDRLPCIASEVISPSIQLSAPNWSASPSSVDDWLAVTGCSSNPGKWSSASDVHNLILPTDAGVHLPHKLNITNTHLKIPQRCALVYWLIRFIRFFRSRIQYLTLVNLMRYFDKYPISHSYRFGDIFDQRPISHSFWFDEIFVFFIFCLFVF